METYYHFIGSIYLSTTSLISLNIFLKEIEQSHDYPTTTRQTFNLYKMCSFCFQHMSRSCCVELQYLKSKSHQAQDWLSTSSNQQKLRLSGKKLLDFRAGNQLMIGLVGCMVLAAWLPNAVHALSDHQRFVNNQLETTHGYI